MLLQIKKFSARLLQPLAKKLVKVPANLITLLGLLSAVVTFFGFIFNLLILIIIFLFITEFFDQLDGIVARLQGPTKLGAFYDSTLDRIGDFFIFFGVILSGYIGNIYTSVIIGVIALMGAFLTSYTRAKIEALGVNNMYGIGIIERTDRVTIIFIGAFLQIWFLSAIWWTMIFLTVFSIITVLQRMIYAYHNFSSKEKKDSNS